MDIFFEERRLIICDSNNDENCILLNSLSNFTEIVDDFANSTEQTLSIKVPNVGEALSLLKNHYKYIKAAGGLVINTKDEILLIFRLGNWDLPKGKIEKNETSDVAALREVEEECGISDMLLGNLLTSTFHTYKCKWQNTNVIKETFWYNMTYNGSETLKPQTEEDIVEAKWVPLKDINKYVGNMYGSIKSAIKLLEDEQ